MSEPYGPGNYPPQVAFDNSGDPSLTQQSFADDADINFIMSKYVTDAHKTDAPLPYTVELSKPRNVFDYATGYAGYGGIPGTEARETAYSVINGAGDDFFDMVNRIRNAEEAFAALPSDLRQRFSNNPRAMLTYLADPANKDEAVGLGIVTSSFTS